MLTAEEIRELRQRILAAEGRAETMDSSALIETLSDADPVLAGAAAEIITRRQHHEALPKLRELLSTTPHRTVRNACALALSEMHDDSCVEPISSLLRDPKTRGCRGTLVYALGPFDVTPLLVLLVELGLTDAYEARNTALDLIDEIEVEPPRDMLLAGQRKAEEIEVSDADGREDKDWLLGWFAEHLSRLGSPN